MIGIESAMPQTQGISTAGEVSTPVSGDSTPDLGVKAGETASNNAETKGLEAIPKAPKAAAKVDETPAYAPNFKFKVLDKEHEFDEWAKAAVKDADTEKKIREIYEKAYGLDSVKQDRHTLKNELTEYRDKVSKTEAALEAVSDFVRQKDYDSFFESLNIPKQDILQYALKLVQREQMPPEQKAVYEQQRTLDMQARQYREQNEQLLKSKQQFEVQQRTHELQAAISRPDISGVVSAYETGMGTPGSFSDYVIRIGQAYAAQGRDIPVEEAVSEAVRHLRAVNPSLGVTQPLTGQQTNAGVVAQANKPVIPNIQGRGTSPVKTAIRSIDDLRNRAKELGV